MFVCTCERMLMIVYMRACVSVYVCVCDCVPVGVCLCVRVSVRNTISHAHHFALVEALSN